MNHLGGDRCPSWAVCCHDDLVLCAHGGHSWHMGCRAQCRWYRGGDWKRKARVWVEGDHEMGCRSGQGWWRRRHWEICQGCPGEWIRGRQRVSKVALPVFFPVAASSLLSDWPACSSRRSRGVNSWTISSDYPHPLKTKPGSRELSC